MRASAFQRRVLDKPLVSFPRRDIVSFLEHTSKDDDYDTLSVRQQVNVGEQMDKFMTKCLVLAEKHVPVTVGIADIARDPTCGKVDSGISIGKTNTLRTNNSHLWILPSPDWKGVFGNRGRLLNVRKKMQGSRHPSRERGTHGCL